LFTRHWPEVVTDNNFKAMSCSYAVGFAELLWQVKAETITSSADL